jgi:hypothetical protein
VRHGNGQYEVAVKVVGPGTWQADGGQGQSWFRVGCDEWVVIAANGLRDTVVVGFAEQMSSGVREAL